MDGTDNEEARRRLWIVEGIEEMRERFPAEAACRTFGVSRATYYEWRRRLKEGVTGNRKLHVFGNRKLHRGRAAGDAPVHHADRRDAWGRRCTGWRRGCC